MIVLKFGGTSLQDRAAVERVAEIVRKRVERRPLVVVSAIGKTTRRLLEAARRAAESSRDGSVEVVDELHARHRDLFRELDPEDPGGTDRFLTDTFGELVRLLDGMSIVGEVPPRALDRILSYGELLSSRLLADALASRGLATRLLDARELIVTDDRHGAATPRAQESRRRLRETVPVILDAGEIPVLQGYIGSTPEGATTTLGFEGSDYTATLAGAALDAGQIEIWKDVPGLMTADPAVVSGVRTVGACSYAEAADLARFGAKILHPRSIGPAARAGSPIRIRSARDPGGKGTRIAHGATEGRDPGSGPVSIAFRRPVEALRLSTSPGETERGGDETGIERLRTLSDALLRDRPELLLVAASSDEMVVVTGPDDADGRSLTESLGGETGDSSMTTDSPRALVTLVGDGIGRSDAVARSLETMAEVPPDLILSGASPRTVHLLVDADSVEATVRHLHAALFE